MFYGIVFAFAIVNVLIVLTCEDTADRVVFIFDTDGVGERTGIGFEIVRKARDFTIVRGTGCIIDIGNGFVIRALLTSVPDVFQAAC